MRIATIYPELLGTYGDGGNAKMLAHRLRLRSRPADVLEVMFGDALPDADIYLLGGGEDGPQRQATDALKADATLASRVENGAVLVAVCAGLQVLGHRFAVADGDDHDGLGMLDLETVRGERRRVGDVAVDVNGRTLIGFENHGGTTNSKETELGRVLVGYGNDGTTDGVRKGRILATYLHGPVLAINPWFADEILELALGEALEPVVSLADELHAERIRKVLQASGRTP